MDSVVGFSDYHRGENEIPAEPNSYMETLEKNLLSFRFLEEFGPLQLWY
jgi:hypothetical protein